MEKYVVEATVKAVIFADDENDAIDTVANRLEALDEIAQVVFATVETGSNT